MKRGFTIIELLVVITTISILIGITMMSYTAYQSRARDSQAASLTAALHAGLERYYGINNEYPLASALYGGSIPGSCASPSSYTTAGSILGIQPPILGGDYAKLSTCATSVNLSVGDPAKVYYITKATATDATQYTLTIGGCTFYIPAAEIGNTAYILVYYKAINGGWRVFKSDHGSLWTSDDNTCPYLGDI